MVGRSLSAWGDFFRIKSNEHQMIVEEAVRMASKNNDLYIRRLYERRVAK